MKPVQRKIDGILLLDKPLNLTSNAALQMVKRLFNAKKAGHTGSLDPLATGMLPICFGEATKFSQFLLESDKHYQVKVKLGQKTTTGDAEGEVISTRPIVDVTAARIEKVMFGFIGAIQQIPPMYSAIKMNGKPLYELARQGIEIERRPRSITIHSINLCQFSNDTFDFNVHCTKGTYVRTLAEDIGEQLGCGAHVIGLHRTAVTPYEKFRMLTMAELEEINQEQGIAGLKQHLLAVETSVQSLPAITLSESSAFYLRTGQSVMVPHLPLQGSVRLYSEDARFLGVGGINSDGKVAPQRLVV
jgi:tRNA pseudouridine55 synthase